MIPKSRSPLQGWAARQQAIDEQQFEEFKDLFETVQVASHKAALKLADQDKAKFRQRNFEDLLARCFRVRMATAIHKRGYPLSEHAEEWLSKLGVGQEDIEWITRQASEKDALAFHRACHY